MATEDTFDTLYTQLVTAWDAHHRLKEHDAAFSLLADSSARLYQARMAMWDWRRATTRNG
jgi:hypothetical protein